jgi:hypothetical protein
MVASGRVIIDFDGQFFDSTSHRAAALAALPATFDAWKTAAGDRPRRTGKRGQRY